MHNYYCCDIYYDEEKYWWIFDEDVGDCTWLLLLLFDIFELVKFWLFIYVFDKGGRENLLLKVDPYIYLFYYYSNDLFVYFLNFKEFYLLNLNL